MKEPCRTQPAQAIQRRPQFFLDTVPRPKSLQMHVHKKWTQKPPLRTRNVKIAICASRRGTYCSVASRVHARRPWVMEASSHRLLFMDRSWKISQQIDHLRTMLQESGLDVRANKSHVLAGVADYIESLQNKLAELDCERQQLKKSKGTSCAMRWVSPIVAKSSISLPPVTP